MSSDTPIEQVTFGDLNLTEPVLQALSDVGYETPTPIQSEIIPHVLNGHDVLGQAQTGTGKTAAFALPILSKIDLNLREPQVLVLAPTRELAIQVAEAFHNYAKHMKGFHVLPIYGGQDIGGQLRQLKRGVHVVVATPGRVMDHMRRGSLKFKDLRCLVLDEADEMLRMGFIDDVEWILEKTPSNRQIALFSATMPTVIRRIAQKYLNDPKEITIKVKTATADTIRQRYWMVSGYHKLDALTRILEAETFDAVIIFVRTKTTTVELAEKLEARGYSAAALNGDIAQNQRERTIERLKTKKLDILIATDVAARGLDVERISHVINYDIPYDTEAYIHRIGRTGRAGRKGDAILFVAPRERRMLKSIERATRKTIDLMQMPSTEIINDKRVSEFKQRISDTLAMGNLGFFTDMMEQYRQEHNIPALDVAAALAHMVQGDTPLLLTEQKQRAPRERDQGRERSRDRDRGDRNDRGDRGERPQRARSTRSEEGMARYRVDVGKANQVKPGNIMGAILNEVDMEREFVGRIEIYDDYSTVDLPEGMPNEILNTLKTVWVAGCQLNMSLDTGKDEKRAYGKKDKSSFASRRKSFSARKSTSQGSRPPRKRR